MEALALAGREATDRHGGGLQDGGHGCAPVVLRLQRRGKLIRHERPASSLRLPRFERERAIAPDPIYGQIVREHQRVLVAPVGVGRQGRADLAGGPIFATGEVRGLEADAGRVSTRSCSDLQRGASIFDGRHAVRATGRVEPDGVGRFNLHDAWPHVARRSRIGPVQRRADRLRLAASVPTDPRLEREGLRSRDHPVVCPPTRAGVLERIRQLVLRLDREPVLAASRRERDRVGDDHRHRAVLKLTGRACTERSVNLRRLSDLRRRRAEDVEALGLWLEHRERLARVEGSRAARQIGDVDAGSPLELARLPATGLPVEGHGLLEDDRVALVFRRGDRFAQVSDLHVSMTAESVFHVYDPHMPAPVRPGVRVRRGAQRRSHIEDGITAALLVVERHHPDERGPVAHRVGAQRRMDLLLNGYARIVPITNELPDQRDPLCRHRVHGVGQIVFAPALAVLLLVHAARVLKRDDGRIGAERDDMFGRIMPLVPAVDGGADLCLFPPWGLFGAVRVRRFHERHMRDVFPLAPLT